MILLKLLTSLTTIDYKSVLPDYFAPLFSKHFSVGLLPYVLTGCIILCFVSILLFLYIRFLRFKKTLKEPHTFLEVRPTYNALEGSLSTIQLFTVLHSIGGTESFIDRFLGIKRTISCELVSTKHDGIRYILKVCESDVASIKKSLLAHLTGIEIREIEDYLPSQYDAVPTKIWAVREYRFKKPFVLPLKKHTTLKEYDPIAYIMSHLTTLQEHELIALQLICTPISPETHSRVTDHIQTIRDYLNRRFDVSSKIRHHGLFVRFLQILGTILLRIVWEVLLILFKLFEFIQPFSMKKSSTDSLAWVIEGAKPKPISELSLTKQTMHTLIEEKINEPLFEVSIRLFIAGNTQDMLRSRLQGIWSSLGTYFHIHQSLKQLTPIPFTTNIKKLKKLQYFRLKERLLSTGSPILSVSELASLYHLPYTISTKTEDIQNIKSLNLPAPLSFKQDTKNLDIVFAHNVYGDATTPIGNTLEERRRQTYIIGRSGSGKTNLLLQMIHQDLIHNKGICVIDPHGELVGDILKMIPEERIKDCVYFNPYDIEHPIGLNLLELPQGLSPVEEQREKDMIISNFISICYKLFGEQFMGPRMENIIRHGILTAFETKDPTLFTLHNILTNTRYRKSIVRNMPDSITKNFWERNFETLTKKQKFDYVSPITSKLEAFLTTPIAASVLDKPKSKLKFDEIMNSQKILICNLAKGRIGEGTSHFLGNILVAKLQQAALRRIDIPQEKRADFYLYIDEFQNFATTSFAEILAEARKYRLCTILAHQNITQIKDNALLETIVGNAGTVIIFRVSAPSDEEIILPLFAPHVQKGQLGNLPLFHFYIKIHATEPQDPFTGEVVHFVNHGSEEIKKRVIEYSRKMYGIPITIHQDRNNQSPKKVNNNIVDAFHEVEEKEINIEV